MQIVVVRGENGQFCLRKVARAGFSEKEFLGRVLKDEQGPGDEHFRLTVLLGEDMEAPPTASENHLYLGRAGGKL